MDSYKGQPNVRQLQAMKAQTLSWWSTKYILKKRKLTSFVDPFVDFDFLKHIFIERFLALNSFVFTLFDCVTINTFIDHESVFRFQSFFR